MTMVKLKYEPVCPYSSVLSLYVNLFVSPPVLRFCYLVKDAMQHLKFNSLVEGVCWYLLVCFFGVYLAF